jgi:hypothetical protein
MLRWRSQGQQQERETQVRAQYGIHGSRCSYKTSREKISGLRRFAIQADYDFSQSSDGTASITAHLITIN